jgi:hypothetical protein
MGQWQGNWMIEKQYVVVRGRMANNRFHIRNFASEKHTWKAASSKRGREVWLFWLLWRFTLPIPEKQHKPTLKGKGKGKVTPLQAYRAQRVLGRLRLPDSVTSALEDGRLSAIHTSRLYPQEDPGTHFKRLSRLRAHRIVGCHGKNPQWHHRGSIPGPSV